MFGQHQRANADEHDQGAQGNGILVRVQDFFACSVLIQKPFRDKDAVIVPHAENERGQDDIDDIELQPRKPHDALNPVPADRQRQKGQETQFQAAEAEPQEEEDNERAKQADGAEILRQTGYQPLRNRGLRGKVYGLEVAALLNRPFLIQGIPERLEGVWRKAGLEALFLQGLHEWPVRSPEGIPSADSRFLRCPIKVGHDALRANALKHGKALCLLLGHVVDMMQVGVESHLPAFPYQQDRSQQKHPQEGLAGPFAGMKIAVEIQFYQRRALPFSLRNKYRKKYQDKENGSHQHHGADKTEIVERVSLQEQETQESTYSSNIPHQQRIHLFCQGSSLVLLIFQVVHIMQRIINGNADDGAANPQHNETHAALEEGDKAQGKQRTGAYGKQDPKDIGQALVAKPKDKADENERYGQCQQRVFFDATGVLCRHLRATRGSDMHVRILLLDAGFQQIEPSNQLGVFATLTAPIGRGEKNDSRFSVFRKQAVVNQL